MTQERPFLSLFPQLKVRRGGDQQEEAWGALKTRLRSVRTEGNWVCLGNGAASPESQDHKEDAASSEAGQLALPSRGRVGECEERAARAFQKQGEAAPPHSHPLPLPPLTGDVCIYFGWKRSARILRSQYTLRPRYGGRGNAKRRFKQER